LPKLLSKKAIETDETTATDFNQQLQTLNIQL
jgi:hypothetical protein